MSSTRRIRIRTKRHGAYWHLDAWPDDGSTQADVLCPHGMAVDVINNNRYDGSEGRQVTRRDLIEWLDEHEQEFLVNVCGYGH